jgi:hypothetical protein
MPKTEASNLAWNFILFVSGVLLSALFSTWLGGLITSQYIFLAIVVVSLALAVMFFLAQTSRRVEQLCYQAVSVVDYYDESYLEYEGIEYKGIIFEELTELVKNAEKEILVLGATRPGEKPYKASNHEERKKYHRAIEDKVKANLEKDFKYIRINQIRQEFSEQPSKDYLGTTLLEHYKRIFSLKKECKNLRATIAILNVPLQYLTSIWFIDGTSVVIEVTGITEDASPYSAGLICITDKGGNTSLKFRKIFDELQRKGQPVNLQKL